MSQTFRCSEEACGREVTYEPQSVPGSIGFNIRKVEKPREFVVYLTCPRGHTHPYTVQSSSSEKQSGN